MLRRTPENRRASARSGARSSAAGRKCTRATGSSATNPGSSSCRRIRPSRWRIARSMSWNGRIGSARRSSGAAPSAPCSSSRSGNRSGEAVDRERVEALLRDLKAGKLTVREAMDGLRALPYDDLGFAKLDSHRDLRRGFPEVILCLGKSPERIVDIARRMSESHRLVLATRASPDVSERLRKSLDGKRVTYHEKASIVSIGVPPKAARGSVLVVTAGTSDIPVAEEAGVTAELMGCSVTRLYDVGVAGVHRIIDRQDLLKEAKVSVGVAGMYGALPSVGAGLGEVSVVARPTSVGYGASFDGMAALLGMMNSCAPGVAVVNIDNGFGAGYLATMMNR